MGNWESSGKTDEWYTPKYIFDALGVKFDMDVAAAPDGCGYVPADTMCRDAFNTKWEGFVWCNPPWCGRGAKQSWIDLNWKHGNGILLAPDRTSAPWWREAALKTDAILLVSGKIKFVRPDGTLGKSPSTGTTLFAYGYKAIQAILNAENNGLGICFKRLTGKTTDSFDYEKQAACYNPKYDHSDFNTIK